MSGNDSESSADVKSWEIVNNTEVQQSTGDDASSSSSEFVNIDQSQVSYHHRDVRGHTPESDEDDLRPPQSQDAERMKYERQPSVEYAADGEDEGEEEEDHPEDSASVSSIEVLETNPLEEEEEEPEHLSYPLLDTTFESDHHLKEDSEQTLAEVQAVEAAGLDLIQVSDPDKELSSLAKPTSADTVLSSSSIEQLPMPSDDEKPNFKTDPDMQDNYQNIEKGAERKGEDRQDNMTQPGEFRPKKFSKRANKVRQDSSDSDGSDFLHMPGPSGRLSLEDVDRVMRISTSSHSSDGSSISGNFRFVHRGHYQYPHDEALARVTLTQSHSLTHRHYSDDDANSLPSDVDDRCESDISGIVADDSDLSHRSLGDVPIAAGNVVRSYRHRPNVSLNTTLTVLALIALFTAVGIGVGHYIGSVRELNLRQAQVAKMRSLQDDYLICLQDQEKLTVRLKTPSARERKLAAVVDVWQQKYEELVVEKADLEQQIRQLEGVMAADLHVANKQIQSHQSEASKIIEELGELRTENQEADKALAAEKHQVVELQQKLEKITAELASTKVQLNSGDLVREEKMIKQKEALKEMSSENAQLQDKLVELNTITTQNAELQAQLKARLLSEQEQANTVQELRKEIDTQKQQLEHMKQATSEGCHINGYCYKTPPLDGATDQYVLSTERDDLVAQVGKMRYGQPAPHYTEPVADESNSSCSSNAEPESVFTDVPRHTNDLCNHTHSTAERGYYRCLSLLLPNISITDLMLYPNLTYNLKHYRVFCHHVVQITKLTAALENEVPATGYADKGDTKKEQDSTESTPILEELYQVLRKHWNGLLENKKVVDIKDKIKMTLLNIKDTATKVKDSERFQNLVNTTKKTVAQVSQQIKASIHKATDLLSQHDGLQKIKETVADNVSSITKNLKDGITKMKDSLSKKLWNWKKGRRETKNSQKSRSQSKPVSKTHEGKQKANNQDKHSFEDKPQKAFQNRHSHVRNTLVDEMKYPESSSGYEKVKETAHGRRDEDDCYKRQWVFTEGSGHGGSGRLDHVVGGSASHNKHKNFEHKPEHKQKQSSNTDQDVYAEFWKQAEFEPDDLLHEGFFEGNNREWRKHQKRTKKLHGRIQRLNEDMLLTMDEDDVDDLYDDLDDLQDDLEDFDVPEQLMNWLTCQIRWWKSRIHRKHRNEFLIKGCGQQLMKWQLRALCKPQCRKPKSKTCKDWVNLSEKLAPFCKGYTTLGFHDKLPKSGSPNQEWHDQETVRITVRANMPDNKKGAIVNDCGQLQYEINSGDTAEETTEKDAMVNETAMEYGLDDIAESELHWNKENTKQDDATWYLRSMYDERHYSPDAVWFFKRAGERDVERNLPWSLKRSDARQTYRIQDVAGKKTRN